jgi:hypothetical protein
MAGPGGDPIMTTRVDITGNVAPLQQAVTQAKAEVKKLEVDTAMSGRAGAAGGGGPVGGAAAQAADATRNLGNEIDRTEKKSRGLFQTMRAGYAAVAGSVLLVIANMQKLVDLLATGETRFASFLKSTEGQGPAEVVAAANKELTELNNKLRGYGIMNPLSILESGFSKQNILDQIAAVESLIEKNQQLADAQKRASRIEAERKALRQLQVEELEGIDLINARRNDAISEIAKKRKGASEEEMKLLDEQAAQVDRNTSRRIAKLNEEQKKVREDAEKATREEEKRAKEAAERQAKALADAYAGAFDRIRADSANAFPAERLIGSIETMIERLEALADQRSRLRG